MALIDTVKPRLGIFYSDTNKNAEIQSMIDGAVSYFGEAGWNIDADSPSNTAVEAVILYCKMAQSTDPDQFANHPVLMSFILQGRTQPSTIATPTATPAGGTYTETQNVTLECSTLYTDIYYTTDGTTPTKESTLYTGTIAISETTTLKVKAFRYGWYDSDVLTVTYTF